MADSEKLAALKKAYADTILNTTKEAAARVLVSEKKARGYQQELVTVRDEALHTLLRLKKMFDSKVKEAEMISLKKQQKVEELEAQLGEAEDIVEELRMELQALHNELEKVTNNGQAHIYKEEDSSWETNDAVPVVREDDSSSSHERSEANGFQVESAVVDNGIKTPSLTGVYSINRCSYKDNNDRCHHTLPSILTKRRETEGSIQMINNGEKLTNTIQNLEDISDCADASISTSSLFNDVKNGEDLNTCQKSFDTPIKTDPRKEVKESYENTKVSTSPLCEESPVLEADKKRCIKYTFKRKRKKEASSSPEGDSSLEESRNIRQKTGEKHDGYLESLEPNFTNESSRDSRRVAQVARQLVPFSKKSFKR